MGYNNFVYRGAARLRPECGKVKGKNMTKIAASILSADFADLKQDCLRLLREGVDLLHTRMFGNKVYIDLEIQVDGDKTLREAHEVAEQVHTEVEQAFPEVKHVMIHVNPAPAAG